MNKEAIEKRLTELRSAQQQYLNNAQACEGAIQDCTHWLSELDKPQFDSESNGEGVLS